MTFKTADLYDQYGDALQVAGPFFSSYGAKSRFHGRVYTLRVFEDFGLVKEAVQQRVDQSVLVIDGGGSLRCALVGDKLAEIALNNGWQGIIVNGCIRDAEDIANLAIGIKAINTCPVKPAQLGDGEREVEVRFAGITFATGAYVYADTDGIVVSALPCD
ncbi:MAG: ribonuclease E activity regulator RraA [Gammaproteobacteria bacterium]|nr:ribonuclease E activity regulator RraA [Gammaproteobacteria bacterium]MDH3467964.1 ribonuclease E activity regulator RraA [Gammaproteobacteria bacterium]